MAIFVKSTNLRPLLTNALSDALRLNDVANVQAEAEARTENVVEALTTDIDWRRFLLTVLIAFLLLAGAIYTAKAGLADISKGLMTSFQSFSGLIVGLLGGEIAASKK